MSMEYPTLSLVDGYGRAGTGSRVTGSPGQ